jgi:hypothetical protein
MALSLPRWIVAASAGCFVVWFGLTHDKSNLTLRRIWQGREFHVAMPTAAELTGRALAATNDRLRSLEIHDSVLAQKYRVPAPKLDVRIDAALPASLREQLDNGIRAKWSALGAPNGVSVVAVVVLDSSRKPHGYPRHAETLRGGQPIAVFPPRKGDQRCIAVLRWLMLPSRSTSRSRPLVLHALLSSETIDALLAPCAYYAKFGQPGPHVAQWLNSSRWQFARSTDWGAVSPPWSDGSEDTDSELLPQVGATKPGVREVVDPAGVACVAGTSGRCAAALLRSRIARTDSSWSATVISTSGAPIFDFYRSSRTTLGPSEGWLLSDMVHILGPQRFQRFWSSSASVPEAFENAADVSLDSWVHAWAVRTYGPVTIGPRMSVAGLASGSVLLLLAFGAAVAIERRRRVR